MYFKKAIFTLVASVLCTQGSASLIQEDINFIQRDLAGRVGEKQGNYSAGIQHNEAHLKELLQQINNLPRPDSVAEDGTLVTSDEDGIKYIMQVGALKQQCDRVELENTVVTLLGKKDQQLFEFYSRFDQVLSAQALLTEKGWYTLNFCPFYDPETGIYKAQFPKLPLVCFLSQDILYNGMPVVEVVLDPARNATLQLVEIDSDALDRQHAEALQKAVEENRAQVLKIFPRAFEDPKKVATEFTNFQIVLRKRAHDLDGKINKYERILKKSLKNLKNAEDILKDVGSSSSTNITFDPQGLLKVGKQFYQIKPVDTNDAETLERTLKHIQGATLHKTKPVQAKLEVARQEQTILAKAVSTFDDLLGLLSNSRQFT